MRWRCQCAGTQGINFHLVFVFGQKMHRPVATLCEMGGVIVHARVRVCSHTLSKFTQHVHVDWAGLCGGARTHCDRWRTVDRPDWMGWAVRCVSAYATIAAHRSVVDRCPTLAAHVMGVGNFVIACE